MLGVSNFDAQIEALDDALVSQDSLGQRGSSRPLFK